MGLGNAELVALGLLAQGPGHGYDLLERARDQRMDAWAPVGRASVYQALDRLERRGWVRGRAVDGAAGPDRREYTLTPAGRAGLRAEVGERAHAAGPYETPAGFALAFGLGAKGRAAYRAALVARIASLADAPADPVAAAMADRQRRLAQADLAWVDRQASALSERR